MNTTLRLNNLKTRTAMNVKFSMFFIFVEAIINLLLYDLLTAPLFMKTVGNC